MKELPSTIDGYRRAYLDGWSPPELMREVLHAVDRHDDAATWIGAIDREDLLERAKKLDAVGDLADMPLFGVPFAVKDNIDVAGVPTTSACPAYASVPAESAAAVRALEAAGGLYVGKTNLDQFATGLTGVRSPYGMPRNPAFPHLVPGGSSSGSATAVAGGVVPLALATDTAGSGRIPAAMTGIVGHKPTPGLVSTVGVRPACRSLDCVSTMTRDVDDALVVFDVLNNFDAEDAFAREPGARQERPWRIPPRLGMPDRAALSLLDPPVLSGFLDRIGHWLDGSPLTMLDLDDLFEVGDLLYGGPWLVERFAAVGEFIEGHPADVLPVIAEIIGEAHRHSAVDVFRAQYRLAELKRRSAALWESVDVLVLPSVPCLPTPEQAVSDPRRLNTRLGRFATFANLLGLCAVTIPCGVGADGDPVSLTLMAPPLHDRSLLALAERIVSRTSVPTPA